MKLISIIKHIFNLTKNFKIFRSTFSKLDKFKCGETSIELKEHIRGEDVVIIQTGYSSAVYL